MEIKEENSGERIIRLVNKEEDSRITIQETHEILGINHCFNVTIRTQESVSVIHAVILLEININY